MQRVVQTCLELFEARNYTLTEKHPLRLSGTRPDGTCVILYLILQDKLNIDTFKHYYALIRQANCQHAILVYQNTLTSSVKNIIKSMSTITLELFTMDELTFNITRHVLVPKHELDDPERHPSRDLNNYPKIRRSDPVCRFYGFATGDIIRITRKNGGIYYRVVK